MAKTAKKPDEDGRRIIKFKDLADIKSGEKELVKFLWEWVSLVEK